MKQLILVRHAKSSWENFSVKDFDRPLNERGNRDAPEMARRLRDKKISIDAFVSSPALRAQSTAAYFAKAYEQKEGDIILIDHLYLASPPAFFEVIRTLNDQFNTIALFSHNDGISAFANELTSTTIDDLPTCGIFAVKAKVDTWKDFEAAAKDFWFFDSPKSGS